MSNYGRNFEFRVPPHHGERGGRYYLPSTAPADLPIGVPVTVADGATPNAAFSGALPVGLAAAAAPPVNGQAGIILYEHGPAAYAGTDPLLTTYSDIDKAPRGKMVQVISGDKVKVVLRNTVDRTFLQSRNYVGRTIVAPANLAGLVVGDMLTPGVGSDAAGYWAETADPTLAWLIVLNVDTARRELECRMTF